MCEMKHDIYTIFSKKVAFVRLLNEKMPLTQAFNEHTTTEGTIPAS